MLVPMHMGGIPELAMVLGPVLPIAVFIWIARRESRSAGHCDGQISPRSDDRASASSCQSVSIEKTGPRAR
jgi:hypothetical protein